MSDTVTLKYLLLGEDKSASSSMKKVGGETDKAGGKLKSFGIGSKLAMLGAGAAVTGFLKDSVQGWADHEQVLRQSQAVIKSTGGVAGITAKQMDDLSGTIESNTGVDGDNVLAGENMLATFTNIHNQAGKGNDIFNQATKIMTDMSVAMGTDMKGQAIQLGKALNDPIHGVGALSKVGVTFTDQQKKQIETMVKAGDTAGAQTVILKELNKEFGGSAKAQETSGQKMAVAFHNLQDTIGQALLPVITKLANFLTNDVLPVVQRLVNFIMEHKTVFTILAIVIGTVVAGLKLWAIAQAILNAVMAVNPIVLIVIAIAALVAAIVFLATKTQFFQKLWHAVWGAIKAAFMAVFNFIKEHWKLIVSILGGPIAAAVVFVISHWKAIKDGFMSVVNYIRDKIGAIVGFFTSIPRRIVGIIGAVANIGKRLGAGLWNGIKGIIGDIGGFGKSLYNAVAQSINWLIDKIRDWHFTIGAFGVHHTFQPFGGIPEIPLMAKGGVVTGPTLAMIGEAGPEAVVPLNRASRFGIGGGGMEVHVHFSGQPLITKADIGRAVLQAAEYAVNQGVTANIGRGIR